MDEAQLRAWLAERECSAELINSIVDTSNEIKNLYKESVEIGAALRHEDWLEEIASTGRETDSNLDRVGWFLLGLTGAVIHFTED